MSVLEPHIVDRNRSVGWIEVVCGSMFSGKTEELIRRLRRARIARQRAEAFKPALDTRFAGDEVVSHDENAIATTPVHTATQILLMADGVDVVGIDETQFFDDQIVHVCRELAAAGKRVIVAGLDQDFRGEPFEPMPQLMAIAEHVTKLHAICVVCGAPANHSQRIVQGEDRVLLGATEAYEPRCRHCFKPHPVRVTPDRVEAALPPDATPSDTASSDTASSDTASSDTASSDTASSDAPPPARVGTTSAGDPDASSRA